MVERRSPKPDVVGSSPTWPVNINNYQVELMDVVCCVLLRTIFLYSARNTCIIVYFLT